MTQTLRQDITDINSHESLGYEKQEKTFRHKDGSYSIWGPQTSDSTSSIWLTALVVKAYSQASKYIDINSERTDQVKIARTRRYLRRKQQRSDGCFKTEGFQLHDLSPRGYFCQKDTTFHQNTTNSMTTLVELSLSRPTE